MANNHSYEKLEILINGEWSQGSAGVSEPVINPATGEVLGQVPHVNEADMDAALAASQAGFDVWSKVSAVERQALINKTCDLLEERRDDICRTLTLEMGKPLAESAMEYGFGIDTLRFYGEEAKRTYGRLIPARAANMRTQVVKEPLGPTLAFVAWNFPAVNVIRKLAGAIASGCSIIIKPSEETPGTAVAIARCFQDAGLPDGVLNVVFGVPAKISDYLMSSSIPKKVSVTGSTAVGKLLAAKAADTMMRSTMELGGHAPVIITENADIEHTLGMCLAGKSRNAGQVCTSPTRFLVASKHYDRFVEGIAENMSALKVGNGLDGDTQMGPLIDDRRIAWMDEIVKDAVAKGARVVTGGERVGEVGSFYAPTVIADATTDMMGMNEEPFGPIMLVMKMDSLDDMLAEANRLNAGLAAYGFTKSQAESLRIQRELNAGVVGINCPAVSLPEAPFGGCNETGWGSEGGLEGIETFMRTKFINELNL